MTQTTNKSSIQDQVQVTIRNLPNDAKNEEIIEYLQIAGPIKTYRFLREEERYSAIVIYYDAEAAQQCKKFLGDRYFKGRALTITTEVKKNYPGPPAYPLTPQEDLNKQIVSLRRDEKKVLLGLLSNLKSDGKIFQMFLESRPKLVEALLNRGYLE